MKVKYILSDPSTYLYFTPERVREKTALISDIIPPSSISYNSDKISPPQYEMGVPDQSWHDSTWKVCFTCIYI